MTHLERATALFKESAERGRQSRERLILSLSDTDALVRHVAAIELARWSERYDGPERRRQPR